MKKNIKWGLVLCSVLIPVCLSACKQGTVEKQGSSNKEVQKKIDRTNIHFDKTGPAASFDWDAKNSSRYITFENLPQYMKPDDSDGIAKYGQRPNEDPLSVDGKVQKALQVIEGVYVDQSGIDTVVKASGATNQENMYTQLWNDYIIPKIEKNSTTFDPNTYVEYLGEKYPLKIYGPMYLKLMTNALRFEKKYELKGYMQLRATKYSFTFRYQNTSQSLYRDGINILERISIKCSMIGSINCIKDMLKKRQIEMIIFPILCFRQF